MRAMDVMSTPVISVGPDTPVEEIARVLLSRAISAVPVLDRDGRLVGIVSEGDLMRRPESGTERKRSWWLTFVSDVDDDAREYVKTHGRRAADVMTRDVLTVDESAPLQSIATLLEKNRIKRVPVMRGDKVVGIVSRANLIQGLAAHPPAPAASLDDEALKDRVLKEIRAAGADAELLNVIVYRGAVQIWGAVRSEAQRTAARIAAERAAGAGSVEEHIGVFPHMVQGLMWGE